MLAAALKAVDAAIAEEEDERQQRPQRDCSRFCSSP
jgi:hypothetical protein